MKRIFFILLLFSFFQRFAQTNDEELEKFCKEKFEKIYGNWQVFARTDVDGSQDFASNSIENSALLDDARKLKMSINEKQLKRFGLEIDAEIAMDSPYNHCNVMPFWKYIFQERIFPSAFNIKYPDKKPKLIFKPNRKMIILSIYGEWREGGRKELHWERLFYVEDLDVLFFLGMYREFYLMKRVE